MQRPAASLVALACLALAPTMQARAAGGPREPSEDARLQRVADVLFPATKAWRRPGSYPTAKRAEIDAVAVAEAKARAAAKEKQGCQDATKLTEAGGGAGFHVIPLTGPGTRSLLYSGQAGCTSGAVTVVWRSMTSPDIGRFETNGETLRIKPPTARDGGFPLLRLERDREFSDVETYSLVTKPGEVGSIVVAHAGLAVPPGASSSDATFVVAETTVLRADPAGEPPYDPDGGRSSHDRTTPDEVAAGATVREHLRHRDPSGREWSLVTAPATLGGDVSTAGWMPTPPDSPRPATARDGARPRR